MARHLEQRTVLVAPASLREKIIKDTHGGVMTGHESVKKNQRKDFGILLVDWHGYENHISTCDKCKNTRKVKRPTTTFLTSLPQCSEPNQRECMDLFGPLKITSSGKS